MNSSENDVSFTCKRKVGNEVVGSRSSICVCCHKSLPVFGSRVER